MSKADLQQKYKDKAVAYAKMQELYAARGAWDPKAKALAKQYQLLGELSTEISADLRQYG